MKKTTVVALSVLLGACATAAFHVTRDGLVEYAGSQKTIFDTGKATAVVPVSVMASEADFFGVGAVEGLDGEITVFKGKPYVAKVRGDGYTIDHLIDHGTVFGVWTSQSKWRDEPIPAEVKGYLDLQNFVKARAAAAGIDVSKPFPFQLAGTPAEVKWHINVDRTGGKPITPELFAKSKANYVVKNQPMDIIGFYSEKHPGIFISAYAPAVPKESGLKNAIHIHLLSRDGKSAGHIDNLTLAPGMILRLPQM
ncbi:MAG: acetolactate decarboxylase [Rhodocyclales bacterium]|nr:acetolactate decarboxylase [Rhodocyclales bacterium]